MLGYFSRLREQFWPSKIWRQWGLHLTLVLWGALLLFSLLLAFLSSSAWPLSTWVWLFVLSFLLALLVGFGLAGYLLAPILNMKDTLEEINQETLSLSDTRLLMKQNNELTDISQNINQLLDKMSDYIDQQVHFVEDASHELRTPVAIVQGHLQLLERWGKRDPEVLEESITSALSEIERMKKLVQEMLDLQRAGQVDVHYANESCDVLTVVSAVVENFKMLYPQAHFYLECDLKLPYQVKMAKSHLEQCLLILLDNAVKYSSDEEAEIHLSVSSDEVKFVEIAVQDFGDGMAPEDQAHIFNRFFRIDKARSREAGGNGLGLPIAKQLIEGYQGEISVESALGVGTIFHIRLLIASEAS